MFLSGDRVNFQDRDITLPKGWTNKGGWGLVHLYLLNIKARVIYKKLEKAFQDADVDRSGTLSLGELRSLMLKMGKNSSIPEHEIMKLLVSLDLDEDGHVTLEDLVELSKSFK